MAVEDAVRYQVAANRDVADIEEHMLRGLSSTERRALDNALTVIADNLS